MKTKSRITSILNATSLDSSITGFPTFNLSELNLVTDLELQLPTNLRLGHLAEHIVSELIKTSTNYIVLYENVQLMEDKTTIGEIDFIIKDKITKQLIHMELAYKFYLFDPTISLEPTGNWIGPNRNDSLKKKLEKLKIKQFPLLYHKCVKSTFNNIEINEVFQALCLLASLYIPYEYKASFNPNYQKAIKGYYVNIEMFIRLHNNSKTYFTPPKLDWGMDPSENKIWIDLNNIKNYIHTSMKEKQALLCWQKYKESYSAFFVVWW